MKDRKLLFIPALAGLLIGLAPVIVHAQTVCPQRTSIFGRVVDVHPTDFTLHTERNELGDIHVLTDKAHVYTGEVQLQDGVFAGVYGCLQPDHQAFRAENVTLARSANDYDGYKRKTVTIEGPVKQISSDRILISSNEGHGDAWVYTPIHGFRLGETVRVTGTFDPDDIAFVAQHITVLNK